MAALAIPVAGFLTTIGSGVTFGLASGTFAAAIGGAVVGAAIGGLTAAVTGGDIGKGLLYGAVGGATVGVGTGMFAASQFASLGTGVAGSYDMVGVVAPYTMQPAGFASSSAAAGTLTEAGKKAAEVQLAKDTVLGATVTGGMQLAGGVLKGIGEQKRFDETMKAQKKQAEDQLKLSYAKLASSEKIAATAASSRGGSQLPWSTSEPGIRFQKQIDDRFNRDNLAEQRRQFDQSYAQASEQFRADLTEKRRQFNVPWEKQEEKRLRGGGVLRQLNLVPGATSNDEPEEMMS